jgi:GNAT superfamily N-acetyltransferase
MQNLVHKRVGLTDSQRPHTNAQRKVVERDGRAVSVRAATPRDKGKLREMFSRLSPETIYRRFHIPYRHVPERMLDLMLDVDHHAGKSLLAIVEREIIGHAMYVRLGDSSEAEMAIVVEDGWQLKGVGKVLLSVLAKRARLRGIESFTGEVLRKNRRMLGLAAVFAETDYTMKDGLWHVRMPLRTLEPTSYAPRTLRRAA